jgi:hypothetical protein
VASLRYYCSHVAPVLRYIVINLILQRHRVLLQRDKGGKYLLIDGAHRFLAVCLARRCFSKFEHLSLSSYVLPEDYYCLEEAQTRSREENRLTSTYVRDSCYDELTMVGSGLKVVYENELRYEFKRTTREFPKRVEEVFLDMKVSGGDKKRIGKPGVSPLYTSKQIWVYKNVLPPAQFVLRAAAQRSETRHFFQIETIYTHVSHNNYILCTLF